MSNEERKRVWAQSLALAVAIERHNALFRGDACVVERNVMATTAALLQNSGGDATTLSVFETCFLAREFGPRHISLDEVLELGRRFLAAAPADEPPLTPSLDESQSTTPSP